MHLFLITIVLLSSNLIRQETVALQIPDSAFETDNFTHLLLHNPLFVDKSLLIDEFLKHDESYPAQLIIRPNGWGKSTNLNMLEKFFEIEVDQKGNPLPTDKTINDKLFLGGTINLSPTETKHLQPLKIATSSNATAHLGQHPVILLRLKNSVGRNYEEMESWMKSRVVEVFKRHEYLSNSTKITQKEKLEKYFKGDFNTEELRDSLHYLGLKLREHFGKEVFLLVDDYDAPLVTAYTDFEKVEGMPESKKFVELLRYILSAARRRTIDIPIDTISTSIRRKYTTAIDLNSTSNPTPDLSTTVTIESVISNTTLGTSTSSLNFTTESIPISTKPSNIIDPSTTTTLNEITSNTTLAPTTESTTAESTSPKPSPPPQDLKRNTALLTGILDLSFENPDTQFSLEFDRVNTLFDIPFARHYGFTHDEVQHLLTKIDKAVDPQNLKYWYNGYNYRYRHEEELHFYNPRSIMRSLHAPIPTFAYYGEDSHLATHGLVYNALSSDEIQEDIQLLISSASHWIGGYTYMITTVRWVRTNIPEVLSNKRTILLFHGLLGPCRPDTFRNGPNIGIPNRESRCVYETNMMRWVCKKFNTNANDLHGFVGLLGTGLIKPFGEDFQKYLSNASDFIKASEYNAKISYGGLMMAVKKILTGRTHNTEDLIENGGIRPLNDILLIPKPDMSKIAIIIQYKIVKEEKDLASVAEAELEQINKRYLNGTIIEIPHPQVRKMYKLGMAFCGEKLEIRYEIRERGNETSTMISQSTTESFQNTTFAFEHFQNKNSSYHFSLSKISTPQSSINVQTDTDDIKNILPNKNKIFVDKTMLIEEYLQLIAKNISALTILRPEGWGKSTNLKMLETFLQIEVDEKGQDLPNDKFFFRGEIPFRHNLPPLKISNSADALKHLGKHPVILLQLENATGNTNEQIERRIKSSIVQVYKRHEYLTHSTKITNVQKLRRYLSGEFDKSELISSMYFLSEKLYEHFDRKVHVFVDDYDSPFISAFINYLTADYRKVGKLLENIYETGLNENPYVSFVLFVGVFPIKTNVEVFYTDEHLSNPPFRKFFGLGNDEVKELLEKLSIDIDLCQIENWYGGYYVGQMNGYYNTRSVMRFIANQGTLDYYGTEISTDPHEIEHWNVKKDLNDIQNFVNSNPAIPSAIVERILILKDLDEYQMTQIFLINGHFIRSNDITEAHSFGSIKDLDYGWSNHYFIYRDILFYAGYLTTNSTGSPKGNMIYFDLFIPNNETKHFYEAKAFQWLCYILDIDTADFNSLVDFILAADMVKFQQTLQNSFSKPKARRLFSFGGYLELYNALVISLKRALSSTHTTKYEYDGEINRNYVVKDSFCILEYEMILFPKPNRSDTVLIFRYAYEDEEEINATVVEGLKRVDELHKQNTSNFQTYSHVSKVIKVSVAFFFKIMEVRCIVDTPKSSFSFKNLKKEKKKNRRSNSTIRQNYRTKHNSTSNTFAPLNHTSNTPLDLDFHLQNETDPC